MRMRTYQSMSSSYLCFCPLGSCLLDSRGQERSVENISLKLFMNDKSDFVMMDDDLYNRGSKRRLSDVDENERLTQRQTILNISICKLQKDHGRKEPPLLRQILIASTVHRIEQEMDEESQMNCFKNDVIYPVYGKTIEAEVKDWTRREARAVTCDNRGPDEIRASFADIGTGIASNVRLSESKVEDAGQQVFVLDETPSKQPNKFGAIGDHRKQIINSGGKKEKDKNSKNSAMNIDLKIWDDNSQLHLPISVPSLESVDGLEFSFQDVDIALYDFDFMSCVPNAHDLKPITDPFHVPFQPLSCGAEADKKKGDSFFDDLDQIMQVLVGM